LVAGGLPLADRHVGQRSGIVPRDGGPGPVKTAPPQFRRPHCPAAESFPQGARWKPWPLFSSRASRHGA
jgi:hypothetical protein